MFFSEVVSKPICHFLAYLYPAFESYKAAKSSDKDLHAQWLTYWIVNSYFSIFEIFGDGLLSWLPLYYEAKIVLLIWLVAPRFRGASQIFEKAVHPYLVKYESDIDASLSALHDKGTEQFQQLGKKTISHLRKSSSDFIQEGQRVMVEGFVNAAVNNVVRERGGSSSNINPDLSDSTSSRRYREESTTIEEVE